MEISRRTRRIVAPALAAAVGLAGVAALKPGSNPNRATAVTTVATSTEHTLGLIAQKTDRSLAEAEARRLSKGSKNPIKTDTNLFPAGVIGQPGGVSSGDEAETSRPEAGSSPSGIAQAQAETGVDHGVNGQAVLANGAETPADPLTGGAVPTGEAPVLSRPMTVPEGLSSQDR